MHHPPPISTLFSGWQTHQQLIIGALRPLTDAQLALRAAPHLRSIGEIATHVIGARGRWFAGLFSAGGDEMAALGKWDYPGKPTRTAAELVAGLEATWRIMHAQIAGWDEAAWARTWPGEAGEPEVLTPPWVLWHLIEHDVHHGGEMSLILGMHGLDAPDL